MPKHRDRHFGALQLARVEGKSLNETVKQSLIEAIERRRNNPKFKARLAKVIEQDRELLERPTR